MNDGAINVSGAVEIVDLAVLNIDESYQRSLKNHHKVIAKSFDPRAATPLLVARREDGSLWLIDGQQRRAAMILRGITSWRAIVVPSSGPIYESKLFNTVNGGGGTVKKLTSRELFKSLMVSGCPIAHATQKAVVDGGLQISLLGNKSTWPRLGCVSTLYTLTSHFGSEVVRKTCYVISKSWHGSDYAMHEFFVEAISMVVRQPGVDLDRLIKKLSSKLPTNIHEKAKNRRYGFTATLIFEVIVEMYNKGLRCNRIGSN